MIAVFEQAAQSFILRLGITLVFVFLGFVIEDHLRARKPASGRAYGQNIRRNLAYTALYFLAQAACAVTVAALLTSLVNDLPGSGLIRIPIPDDGPWWMTALAVIVALGIFDFFYYWVHRAQHTWGWLWAIHELHHSDEHMNVTTTYRHHWLQAPLDLAIGIPLVYVLAPIPAVPAGSILLRYALGHFIHLNARIQLRPIRWVLVSPQHHRIHHSSEPGHRDRNFAGAFPFWDLLFGTYYGAAQDEHPDTGLTEVRRVNTFAEDVAWPWPQRAGEAAAAVVGGVPFLKADTTRRRVR